MVMKISLSHKSLLASGAEKRFLVLRSVLLQLMTPVCACFEAFPTFLTSNEGVSELDMPLEYFSMLKGLVALVTFDVFISVRASHVIKKSLFSYFLSTNVTYLHSEICHLLKFPDTMMLFLVVLEAAKVSEGTLAFITLELSLFAWIVNQLMSPKFCLCSINLATNLTRVSITNVS